MRILLVCPQKLDKRFGISKVYLEAAESYMTFGVECKVVGAELLLKPGDVYDMELIGKRLKEYLEVIEEPYDIIEVEHHLLPQLPKFKFPKRPLLVGRSSLLMHFMPIYERFWNNWLGILKYPLRKYRLNQRAKKIIRLANKTIANCDLILLSNPDEIAKLAEIGVPANKMFLSPYGLTKERRELFNKEKKNAKHTKMKTVVMVGTLDPRKGLNHLPKIVDKVLSKEPEAQFYFLGTGFFIPDKNRQLKVFTKNSRENIIIKQIFDPHELPSILCQMKVGIFPSTWEGCPFGVLEMVCAGLPVYGFKAPGTSMILPNENLVSEGDCETLAQMVIENLRDNQLFNLIQLPEQFYWENISKEAIEIYKRKLENFI
jgi:glycosyltransferase involved in cell wall biosynthesis